MKSSKPEPGEVSSLNSSTSSKKDDSLKRHRGSQDLNDSSEEEEGDLLEDEDEVRSRDEGKTRAKISSLIIQEVSSVYKYQKILQLIFF